MSKTIRDDRANIEKVTIEEPYSHSSMLSSLSIKETTTNDNVHVSSSKKKSKTQSTLNFKQLTELSRKKQGYVVNLSKHEVHLIIRELALSDDEQNKRIKNYRGRK